jgi:Cu(I)/Ag(I) efflux system membrane fusion protein
MMKKSIYIILLALSLTIAFNTCSNSAPKSPAVESKATEKIVYTCSMHPEVRRDKPGKCPKCGMELVRMENDHSDTIHNN